MIVRFEGKTAQPVGINPEHVAAVRMVDVKHGPMLSELIMANVHEDAQRIVIRGSVPDTIQHLNAASGRPSPEASPAILG